MLEQCFGATDDEVMESLSGLFKAMHKRAINGSDKAAEILLNRVYGQSRQTVELDDVSKNKMPQIVVSDMDTADALKKLYAEGIGKSSS